MTTIDSATRAWLDQEDRRTADVIRRYGVEIVYVGVDACCAACGTGVDGARADAAPSDELTSFAYTVGLFGIGHSEVLVFGLGPVDSCRLLNDVAERVREGGDLTEGQLLEFSHGRRRVLVERVPNPGEIAFAANRFYQRPAQASVGLLQLSYDDDGGHFPGQPGYSLAGSLQPRPGTFRA